jgi:hypothetical protein
MAQLIADRMDLDRFGVRAVYVIGSTKNATAGPGSDIDLMIHVGDDAGKVEMLKAWIEGWSYCLDELNHFMTGHRTGHGLIDMHLITDQDILDRTSFAVKISAVDDRARVMRLKKG